MGLLLDTNRYSDFARGEAVVVDVIERADAVQLAFATLAELRCGFLAGSRRDANERRLDAFLERPGVSVLFPHQATARHYAGCGSRYGAEV